jgi:hypothetical protein
MQVPRDAAAFGLADIFDAAFSDCPLVLSLAQRLRGVSARADVAV